MSLALRVPVLEAVPPALSDVFGLSEKTAPLDDHLLAAIDWLCRAQDAGGGRGVARSYSLRWQRSYGKSGWLPPYPETTGYIIPTFYDYAALTGRDDLRQRAFRMAEWESEAQLDNGAVQGAVLGLEPTPAVFNTGQVLFGWTRAYDETLTPRFLESAVRAADFLVGAQDQDGAWRLHGSRYARSGINVYDTRTAWGVARAWQVTGDDRYRSCARRNLEFARGRLHDNGWIEECCLDDDRRPLLHTLAYAMEGFLEGGLVLGEEAFVDAARRTADSLLARQRDDGSLAGRFDAEWRPAVRWGCLTGDAQTAICWWRLFEVTGDERYRGAGRAMNRYLMRTQRVEDPNPGVRGGIKGSHPIWGGYGPYEYLNWAAKFFVDALLLERRLGGAR